MHVCVHVSLLNVYRALFSVYTALLNMYRALLSVYGAFDMFARVCVSLLNVNRALLSVCKKKFKSYRSFLSCKVLSSVLLLHSFALECILTLESNIDMGWLRLVGSLK